MADWLSRQKSLIGEKATAALTNARVAVIGLGGVGGAALEGIARAGVGNIFVMDFDVFDETNLNRQILATREALGKSKSEVAAARIMSINPEAKVVAYSEAFSEETKGLLIDFKPDYIIDAVDMVSAKLLIIETAKKNGFSAVSSMGTGNRTTAQGFVVGDIADTAGCGCPLARVMRRELKKRGICGVEVLFNLKEPKKTQGERTPASISYVPPVAGYLLSEYVVQKLANI